MLELRAQAPEDLTDLMPKWSVEAIELVTGYVFIDAEKGRALEVASEVLKIKGVKTTCVVTGTFDVIATFDVKDVNTIGEMVARGIHGVDGVYLTQTAICVKCCSK